MIPSSVVGQGDEAALAGSATGTLAYSTASDPAAVSVLSVAMERARTCAGEAGALLASTETVLDDLLITARSMHWSPFQSAIAAIDPKHGQLHHPTPRSAATESRPSALPPKTAIRIGRRYYLLR